VKPGHREAQDLFLELGRARSFQVRRTFSRSHPTDGVWVLGPEHGELAGLPVVAIEVVASETGKGLLGAIGTLSAVSPLLGIILVQEEEIVRRLIRRGLSRNHALQRLTQLQGRVDDFVEQSPQRIQRWSFQRLVWLHSIVFREGPANFSYEGLCRCRQVPAAA
jgi:hypothetical protein